MNSLLHLNIWQSSFLASMKFLIAIYRRSLKSSHLVICFIMLLRRLTVIFSRSMRALLCFSFKFWAKDMTR